MRCHSGLEHLSSLQRTGLLHVLPAVATRKRWLVASVNRASVASRSFGSWRTWYVSISKCSVHLHMFSVCSVVYHCFWMSDLCQYAFGSCYFVARLYALYHVSLCTLWIGRRPTVSSCWKLSTVCARPECSMLFHPDLLCRLFGCTNLPHSAQTLLCVVQLLFIIMSGSNECVPRRTAIKNVILCGITCVIVGLDKGLILHIIRTSSLWAYRRFYVCMCVSVSGILLRKVPCILLKRLIASCHLLIFLLVGRTLLSYTQQN
jgi:hypothetical protein